MRGIYRVKIIIYIEKNIYKIEYIYKIRYIHRVISRIYIE